MEFNRTLAVYTTTNRKAKVYRAAPQTVGELFKRLGVSQPIPYDIRAYKALKKAQQDDLKDVGGFVLGELNGGRRRSGAVLSRSAAVLDADNVSSGGTDEFIRRVAALGWCCFVHSTAKHCPESPRLRAVFPFAEDIPTEQYPVIARLLCQMIQPEMTWFDPTTAEAERMMYWASHCKDVDPVHKVLGGPLLDVADLLARQLPAWQDPATWPRFPSEQKNLDRALGKARQQDPTEKNGVVGAFCRAYDVPAAMAKFLSGVYEETTTEGRYTFAGGSTWGGALLYEDGKFLYSHHATDPACGQLVNAFDLVRLHKFGELDDEPEGEHWGNRLPSYAAMSELAQTDELVKDELAREALARAKADFRDEPSDEGPVDVSWMRKLTRTGKGSIEHSSANILHTLEHDPRLQGRIYLDTFADKVYGIAPLPWGNHTVEKGPFEWVDADDDGLGIYLERLLGFRSPALVRSSLNDHMARCAVNPVTDYLGGLAWDGVPRLDRLLIDYLGADDSPYTRAVTRKSFTAAVARAMDPGCKYDQMLILAGAQGTFKSSTLAILGGEWFTDSLLTFNGKDAMEVLQGKWIIELGELQAFSNTDVNKIKQFISSPSDRYRAAYGRRPADHPRRCVFFGTTNTREFLRDFTGGRRFWPVYTGVRRPVKDVWERLPGERDQIWAEAVDCWKQGETLYLNGELRREAETVQETAREEDPRAGLVRDFLEKPVPKDWQDWTIERRQSFWVLEPDALEPKREMVPRDRVCALEIWCELFQRRKSEMQTRDSRAINAILETTPGWERIPDTARFGAYGKQRGFRPVWGPVQCSVDKSCQQSTQPK